MRTRVPLVEYVNGERRIVGEAEVDFTDGMITIENAQIDENASDKVKGMQWPFSIGFKNKES